MPVAFNYNPEVLFNRLINKHLCKIARLSTLVDREKGSPEIMEWENNITICQTSFSNN